MDGVIPNPIDTEVYGKVVGIDKPTMTAVYLYDASDRRVMSRVNGYATYFVLEGDRVLQEVDGNSSQVTKEYVWGSAIDELVILQTSGEIYHAHADALGSTALLTDATGDIVERYDYNPFGACVASDINGGGLVGNPYRFTGRRLDTETGLYYYRSRHYTAEMGRFLSRDPIGSWGDPGNSGNGYAYAGNNPLTYTDPSGEWGLASLVGAVVGAVVDAAIEVTTQIVTEGTVSDWGSVGAAAVEGAISGAVSGGLSTLKTAGKLVKSGIEFAAEVGAAMGGQAVRGEKISVGGAVSGAAADKVGGKKTKKSKNKPKTKKEKKNKTNKKEKGDKSGKAGNRPPKGGACFPAGTIIVTPNGKLLIEDIVKGDVVHGLDLETGKVVECVVEQTFKNYTYYWVDIQLSDETIVATRSHRFWIESEQSWIAAIEIKPGMSVRCESGATRKIQGAFVRELSEPEETFNLEVEISHNYFVGNCGILVHNGDGEGNYTVYRGDDDYVGKTNDLERRYKEWARKGRRIQPTHEGIPDNDTALGVEQTEIERNKKKGIGPKQRNAVDPNRTDDKANRRREKGRDWLEKKEGGC